MSNLLTRALTGIVFVGVILGSIFWHPVAASAVLAIFMLLGIVEFYILFKGHSKIDLSLTAGLISALAILGVFAAGIYGLIPKSATGVFILPIIFLLVLTELWRKKEHPIENMAASVLGVLYVLIPFLLLINASFADRSTFPIVAGMFILIWSNDTFAYLTGRMIGKTKLIERISPNKTWEGTIGGVIMSIAAGAVIGYFTNNYLYWTVAGAIIASTASLGDLLESLIKRSLKIKDSGNILPGHGGILDRFDAMLFTVPFFLMWNFVYLILF
ncbi:MAG: phosphatidate cytidylyltransferase [Crocinitomicaceae bacterium]|nr:phosphatidate cytidylyltransferase [Crocinitomicaceae bacterium]MDG1657744.1 phosphatidate cytidylyltransferase [Crocinitomicaceae bacterium]